MTNDGRLLIDITLPADYREIQELFYQVKRDGEGESPSTTERRIECVIWFYPV